MLKPLNRSPWAQKGADFGSPNCLCPNCGHHFNAMGHPAHKEKPEPGDYGVCIRCATVLCIQPDYTMGWPDPFVFRAACEANPHLVRNLEMAQRAIREMEAEFGGLPPPPAMGRV